MPNTYLALAPWDVPPDSSSPQEKLPDSTKSAATLTWHAPVPRASLDLDLQILWQVEALIFLKFEND